MNELKCSSQSDCNQWIKCLVRKMKDFGCTILFSISVLNCNCLTLILTHAARFIKYASGFLIMKYDPYMLNSFALKSRMLCANCQQRSFGFELFALVFNFFSLNFWVMHTSSHYSYCSFFWWPHWLFLLFVSLLHCADILNQPTGKDYQDASHLVLLH